MSFLSKELVRFGIGSAIKSLQEQSSPIFIDPSKHPTPDGGEGWSFNGVGGEFQYFKYDGYKSCTEAYNRCPPISAIINRKSQAFINGQTWLLDKDGAVAETKEAKEFNKLWKKPNPIQSQKQFEAQLYSYFQLFGFAIIFPVKPVGYTKNIEASSLWNIPISWIDWNKTYEKFTLSGVQILQEIVVNFSGYYTTLKIADLIIIRDVTISFDNITFPTSKINPLQMPINNIIGAFESRNTLINYRGAFGILSTDPGKGQYVPLPLGEIEKEKLQKDFRRYGLRKKQFQVILTTASLKWQSMGYPTKDLMLMEEVQESSKSVCDGMNFPPHLLGLIDPTFNNQSTAEKGLYRNAIIPDADNIFDQLQTAFDFDKYGLNFEKDFSKIESLQSDKKFEAEARLQLNNALQIEWNNGLITLDQWLEKLGEDPLPNNSGQVRKGDTENKNVPLAVTIGVGGIQGLLSVLTASNLSSEARQATLEILFGLSASDAERMSESSSTQNQNQ